MDTVTFPCGHCGQQMVVEVANLGKQVECPHCRQAVHPPDAPPAEAAPPPQAEPASTVPMFHVPAAAEQESIFSAPEEEADDLFGGPATPKVQIPPSPLPPELRLEPLTPAAEPVPSPVASVDIPATYAEPPRSASSETALYLDPAPPPPPDFTVAAEPAPLPAAAPPPSLVVASSTEFTSEPAQSLTPPEADVAAAIPTVPRRPVPAGTFGTLLLIFLIPYAVVATAAVGWLVYQQRTAAPPFDPLERLPDPKPGDGGPMRVKHNAALPERLKTALNQKLRVGDVEVTPLSVGRVEEGGKQVLTLDLKIRNLSGALAFNPLPPAFVKYQPGLTDLKPYTFLEVGDAVAYGGYVEYDNPPKRAANRPFDGVLQPGEEATFRVRTHARFVGVVERVDRHKGPLLWRVQVRRGFVQVKGKDVSATAVVGVRIDPGDVPRAPARDAAVPAPGAGILQAASTPINTPSTGKSPRFF